MRRHLLDWSGSSRVLTANGKDISVDHSLSILRMCREVGIQPNAGFILGFADDDAASARDTFEAYEAALRIGCKPTHIQVCPFAASSGLSVASRTEQRTPS
ncbi:MAG: hypothetical protein IPL62_19135 [Caulobacteraceae bacterium]|nr:hypothetical protein [Caulobacteraceae bacterium]